MDVSRIDHERFIPRWGVMRDESEYLCRWTKKFYFLTSLQTMIQILQITTFHFSLNFMFPSLEIFYHCKEHSVYFL